MPSVSSPADASAKLLDVAAAAEMLGCSKRHVHRLSDSGRMPAPVKLGSLVRWSASAIREWIDTGCPAHDSTPSRDKVFISYSHKDRRWLDDLLIHLKPYLRDGSVTAWSDQQIAPGSKWFAEIRAAIAATKVAVLLVTPDFLASEFIHEHELGPLLKEAEVGGVRIIWVPVRSCSYGKTPLKDYQAVIDPKSPLASIKAKADRDTVWVRVCEEIEKAVNR